MRAWLLLPALLLVSPPAQAFVYSQYVIYKSGGRPLPTQTEAAWKDIGNAYSASAVPMPFDDMKKAGAVVKSARAYVVWRAGSRRFDTGVEVLACPAQHAAERALDGCTVLAMFAANDTNGPSQATRGCVSNPGGPFPCVSDVTARLRSLIANGVPLYMTAATYGNGQNGPLLYDVELLVEWDN